MRPQAAPTGHLGQYAAAVQAVPRLGCRGIGYVLVVPADQAEEAINRIQAFKLRAWCIGEIARRSKDDDQEQVIINF